jgi:hypothetical protein
MDDGIQALVDEALDNATDNGYDMFDLPEVVAVDMATFDSDIETLVEEEFDGDECELVPYIEDWQVRHG